jgi:hypothetical protein
MQKNGQKFLHNLYNVKITCYNLNIVKIMEAMV